MPNIVHRKSLYYSSESSAYLRKKANYEKLDNWPESELSKVHNTQISIEASAWKNKNGSTLPKTSLIRWYKYQNTTFQFAKLLADPIFM